MKLRTLLVPLALLAALSVVTAQPAEAAPMSSQHSKAFFGPKVFVGGGIGFSVPLGRRSAVRHRAVRHRVVQPSGYWTTVPEQVWIPGHVIGYDSYHRPIVSAGHYQTVYRRVWVQTPVVVHRRARIRPRIHVGVGLGGRIRFR